MLDKENELVFFHKHDPHAHFCDSVKFKIDQQMREGEHDMRWEVQVRGK